MNQIDLIGLSHNDPKTEQRLRNAFAKLSPDVMTLEYPSDQQGFADFWNSPEWRRRMKEIELQFGEPVFDSSTNQPILNIANGSEIVVLQQLYEETRIPLFCVDDVRSKIKFTMSPHFADAFKALRSARADDPELLSEMEEVYVHFSDHLKGRKPSNELTELLAHYSKNLILDAEREAFQRDRIKEVFKMSPYKTTRLMHVGGLAHLADMEGIPTLYSLLKKDLPASSYQIRRHALSEFDKEI